MGPPWQRQLQEQSHIPAEVIGRKPYENGAQHCGPSPELTPCDPKPQPIAPLPSQAKGPAHRPPSSYCQPASSQILKRGIQVTAGESLLRKHLGPLFTFCFSGQNHELHTKQQGNSIRGLISLQNHCSWLSSSGDVRIDILTEEKKPSKNCFSAPALTLILGK